MVTFMQIEIKKEFGLPFKEGSQLLIMMCPDHNEALLHEASWKPGKTIKLPSKWWNDKSLKHVGLFLFPPSDFKVKEEGLYIVPQKISFEKIEETSEKFEDTSFIKGMDGFKIGGYPAWYQEAKRFKCSCGGTMEFICQIPSSYEIEGVFKRKENAPEQPNTDSSEHYTPVSW